MYRPTAAALTLKCGLFLGNSWYYVYTHVSQSSVYASTCRPTSVFLLFQNVLKITYSVIWMLSVILKFIMRWIFIYLFIYHNSVQCIIVGKTWTTRGRTSTSAWRLRNVAHFVHKTEGTQNSMFICMPYRKVRRACNPVLWRGEELQSL